GELDELGAKARKLLQRWKQDPDSWNATAAAPSAADPRNLPDFVTEAQRQFASLRRLILPRILQGKRYYLLVFFLALLTLGVWYLQRGLQDPLLGGGLATGALVLGLALRPLLGRMAMKQI